MNRTILLLNVIVLVVNFALAFTTTDSQIGIMQSASNITGARIYRRERATDDGAALAYLRVVQSLGNVMPESALEEISARQYRALYVAVAGYYRKVADGVADLSHLEEKGEALRRSHAALGKEAREHVEDTLASSFPNAAILRRLTTEVIKSCG